MTKNKHYKVVSKSHKNSEDNYVMICFYGSILRVKVFFSNSTKVR